MTQTVTGTIAGTVAVQLPDPVAGPPGPQGQPGAPGLQGPQGPAATVDVSALAAAVAAILASAPPPAPPTVSLAVSPPSLQVGGQATVTWSTTGATSVVATGAWTGNQAASGVLKTDPVLTGTFVYTLTATGPGGSTSTSATMTVNPVVNPATPMGPTAAAQLLNQATFGATIDSVAAAAPLSALQWIQAQMALPVTGFQATANSAAAVADGVAGSSSTPYYTMAVQAPDQLRQRVAFMLSELFVTSFSADQSHKLAQGVLYDVFLAGCFGSYEKLLADVSTSMGMGLFLNAFRNSAALPGQHADENYAREIQQLFSIGLNMLNPDGSLQLDAAGNPVPTYTQAEITEMARVFTGWGSAPNAVGGHPGDGAYQYDTNEALPMVGYDDYHDRGAKTIVGGLVLPAGQTAAQDLAQTVHALAQHQNVGPFLGRQFIQRLVTSNPSPAYVARVSAAWADDGKGARGNLGAVVTAILTDPEASSADPKHGKLREPLVMLTHLWRAFKASNANGENFSLNVTQLVQSWLGQAPMQSKTVFNYFTPFFSPQGPVQDAGLVAPEFEILNENTVAGCAQMWAKLCGQWRNSAGLLSGQGTVINNTAQWEPLAANPAALVAELNLVFCAGSLPSAAQVALTNYAKTLPASQPWLVAMGTAQALMTSPQYAIQR